MSCVLEKPKLLICAIAIALATEAEGSVRATPDAPDADVVMAAVNQCWAAVVAFCTLLLDMW